jgi:hypothetical protein
MKVHKTKNSWFTKMEDSLIVKVVSALVAPTMLPSVVVVPMTSAPTISTLNSMSIS